jgi:hypothetical protein
MGVREASVAEFDAGSSSDVGRAQARKLAKHALIVSPADCWPPSVS